MITNHIQMHLQPIFCLTTGHVAKVEALARLKTSNGQLLLPVSFLSTLTEPDLVTLFCEGLTQILHWLKKQDGKGSVAYAKLDMCINMPPSFLNKRQVIDYVKNALISHNIEPSRLIVEILETQTINHETQIEGIASLKNIGVRLGLDDLGSGHSSLLRLASHPFDIIKIDKGFIRAIHTRPLQIFAVIRGIFNMATELNCDVVIEGLENTAAIEAVRFLGCSFGQGFGLAKPMAQSKLSNWLLTNKKLSLDQAIKTDLGALACLWQSHRGSLQPVMTWLEHQIINGSTVDAV